MTDGFEVDADQLRQHAGKLDRPRSRVDLVADAGKQVTPGGWDNAYGLLCQAFPQATRPLAEKQLEGIRKISEALRSTSEQLSRAADQYRQADEAGAQQLTKLQSELGDVGQLPGLPDGPPPNQGHVGHLPGQPDGPPPPKEVDR